MPRARAGLGRTAAITGARVASKALPERGLAQAQLPFCGVGEKTRLARVDLTTLGLRDALQPPGYCGTPLACLRS